MGPCVNDCNRSEEKIGVSEGFLKQDFRKYFFESNTHRLSHQNQDHLTTESDADITLSGIAVAVTSTI
jgi:hypothetical protein